ncbi:glucosaminidase domain-containing protein [Holdemania massiliensis]|uniref:Mannosyl-glycoprotein endo-beta-N-acetylglucosamidase-like domain-containing protein n=1 Tax=Holdemania massiliensis TaxID=1468449 RepID=A0A6N7S8V9_9FIRM|nr:glucosaminidase domain-containing protein [Holdemania massiliensis]MSA72021.1 hypothetical protein [Holdemania massiliensis]MSA90297.1 hypothetical protein [Holdemania massiliensis]MSB79103.1 hypothetical protein [Holdemania massiliensis]MSC34027.1 hypothetical protein [Holdemania massiliensis]MSC40417.1 hypothetical protein [Holdemania massiliensis]
MKKALKFLLSVFVALTLIQNYSSDKPVTKVIAEGTYPMACGNYEVSWVNDNGTFSEISCHNDLGSALNTMFNYGIDAVVRHPASKSPTKIIAMVSGLVASYSYRRGSNVTQTGDVVKRVADSTVTITQYESSGEETYVTSHREMIYQQTASYNPSNGTGKIGVNLTGFDGFINLDQVDLIPMKFVTRGLSIQLGGNNDGTPWESPFWVNPKQSYYEVVQNGNYKDLVYHVWSYWANSSRVPQDYSQTIGPAEDWMTVGSKYYTNNMHHLYSDPYFQNKVMNNGQHAAYYNYYEMLPLRSQTNISGQTLDAFLAQRYSADSSKMYGTGSIFTSNQESYGVNALLVYCLGLLESAWGTSKYAKEYNNLFGWNAVDSDPDKAEYFDSIEKCIKEQMGINLRGYMDVQNWRFFGYHFGNKGAGFNVKYASDPYWGLKVAALAYSIDKFAAGYNGDLIDYGTYDLGLINQVNASVKRYSDANSSTLFNASFSQSNYMKDYSIIIQSNNQGWIGFPTPNGVRADGSLVLHGKGFENYDWNNSVGYLRNDQITPLGIIEAEGNKPVGDFVQKITELSLNGSKLTIKGYAYQPGLYVQNVEQLTHQLVIEDADGNKQMYNLTQAEYTDQNYKAAGFAESEIPLDLLLTDVGTYKLYIRTIHDTYDETKPLSDITLPETGSELLFDYVFENQNGGVTVTKKAHVIQEYFNTLVQRFTLSEEGKLSIKGIAFVEGRHQGSPEQISHQLLVSRVDSDEVIKTFDLTSYVGDEGDPNLNLGYNHTQLGFDYSYGYYKGDVDISDLPDGDYSFTIKTISDGKEFTRKLYGLSNMKDSGVLTLSNGKFGELKRQYEFSNRFELAIRNYKIELPEGKQPLPRIRESYQYLSKIAFSENDENLIIKGAGFIWNGDFSAEQHPKYTLYLIHKETGKIHSYQVDGLTALTEGDYSWDMTEEKGGNYDYSHIWYEFAVPMLELEDGNFELKLMVETDSYVDLLDLKSRASIKLPSVDSEKKFKATRNTKNKYKIEFELKGWYVEPISLESENLNDNEEAGNPTDSPEETNVPKPTVEASETPNG